MNISHHMAQEFMHKGLHEPLGKEELALLEVHLVGCPECAGYQTRLLDLETGLRRVLPAHRAHRDFSHAEINQKLAEIQPVLRRKRMSQRLGVYSRQLSFAAAALFMVFGLIFIINNLRPGAVPSAALTETPAVVVPPLPVAPTPTALPSEPLPSQIYPGSLAWSPGGKWLAYTLFPAGKILLHNPDSGETAEVKGIPAGEHATLQTAWSPQGDRLVVYGVWGSDLPHLTGIWSVVVTSQGPDPAVELVPPSQANSPVQQNEGAILSLDWSGDGKRLVYSYNAEAWVYYFETGESRRVTQVTENPLPRQGGSEPFDGVQEVFIAPDGSSVALGLTCNCPSPWSGVGVVSLENGETKLLVDGGRPTGWTPEGDRVTLQNVTGDWSGGYTYDTYAIDPATGELTNLTRSNPAFDPLVDGWDAYHEAPYQAHGLTWGADGRYLFQAWDYRQAEAGEPALGYVLRSGPQTILEERLGDPETWYLEPALLPDGRLAYLEANPIPAGSPNSLSYAVRGVVVGEVKIPFRVGPRYVSAAVWSPDGRSVALAAAPAPDQPADQVLVLPLDGGAFDETVSSTSSPEPTPVPPGVFALEFYPPLVMDYDPSVWKDESRPDPSMMVNYLQALELETCQISVHGPSGWPEHPYEAVTLGEIRYLVMIFEDPSLETISAWYTEDHTLPNYNYDLGLPIPVVQASRAEWDRCKALAEEVLATLHVPE